jgi:hypothetical protein
VRRPTWSSEAVGRGLEAAAGAETEAAVAARLRDEVAGRLRRACAAMTPDLFARVVEAVVARHIRWARRAAAEYRAGRG